MTDTLIHTTSTGVKLFENGFSKNATAHAKSLRLRDIKVFLAVLPDETKQWVIFRGENAIYETQYYEQIETRLDAIKVASKRGGKP